MTDYAKPIVRLSVYKNRGQDYSNGGVSSRHDEVDLYPYETLASEVDPAKLDRAVVLVYRSFMGGLVHAEPLNQDHSQITGMAGGTYVGTSDSRLGREVHRVGGPEFFHGAIALHDRQETQAQYDRFSR